VIDFRKMQVVLDIIKHQEVHLWNTIWDTIGPYSMQARFSIRSCQDCSNRQLATTKNNPSTKSDIGTHKILQNFYKRVRADHRANGETTKERHKVLVE
jgi:hypothetical protein